MIKIYHRCKLNYLDSLLHKVLDSYNSMHPKNKLFINYKYY